jgi:hypothetical protein
MDLLLEAFAGQSVDMSASSFAYICNYCNIGLILPEEGAPIMCSSCEQYNMLLCRGKEDAFVRGQWNAYPVFHTEKLDREKLAELL